MQILTNILAWPLSGSDFGVEHVAAVSITLAASSALGIWLARRRFQPDETFLRRGVCPDCREGGINFQPSGHDRATAYCFGCGSSWLVVTPAGQPIVRLAGDRLARNEATITMRYEPDSNRVCFATETGTVAFSLDAVATISATEHTGADTPRGLLRALVVEGVRPIYIKLRDPLSAGAHDPWLVFQQNAGVDLADHVGEDERRS